MRRNKQRFDLARLGIERLEQRELLASSVVFNFEELAATPRNGGYSTLVTEKSGLKLTITRPGTAFDVVDNNLSDQEKPAAFGNRSLDPFFDDSAVPFIFNFSQPVVSVSLLIGDFGQDTPDNLRMQAFSGANASGDQISSDQDSLPTLADDAFNDRQLAVTGGNIRSLRVIGGTPEFPNSTFIDRVVAEFQPDVVQPKQIVARSDGSLLVRYVVTETLSSDETIPISVYWAKSRLGLDALPDGNPRVLHTYEVAGNTVPGTYSFEVPAGKLLTAPNNARHLLVVANPEVNLNSTTSTQSQLSVPASTANLTVAQLRKIMPNLTDAEASRYAGPLNQAMFNFNIRTFEQRAMFLAQISHESSGLSRWIEQYNGSSATDYFINKYWVAQGQWANLGDSVPTSTGITLKIAAPANAPARKNFRLYFAKGPALADGAQLETTLSFVKTGGFYQAHFNGAIPPALTTHLLVVNPTNNQVMAAIRNRLGNWRPIDAADFRGRGPVQLTGRYNYQLYANYASLQSVMINPALLSDKSNPSRGLESAGWFWKAGNPKQTNLNTTTNDSAYSTSSAFNRAVTLIINGGYNGEADRLKRYRRIRSILLTPVEP